MSLCVSSVVLSLNVLPHSSHMKSFIPEVKILELAPSAQFIPADVTSFTRLANSGLHFHFINQTHTLTLTCVSLVVFQHIDLLGKLAVTLLALVLLNPFVQLHVVSESMLGLHACEGEPTSDSWNH